MLVASSSMVELQQSHQHRYLSDDSSDQDMAYHMRRDSQSFNQRNSFQQIGSPKYCLSGYKEEVSNNVSRMYNPSSGNEPFYMDSQSSDSGSPQEKKFISRVMGHSSQVNHKLPPSDNYGAQVSPTRFSPPHKRLLPNSPTQFYDSQLEGPPNISLSPRERDGDTKETRFSSNIDGWKCIQTKIVASKDRYRNESSTEMSVTSRVPFDDLMEKAYYERSYAVNRNDVSENDIDHPRSPANIRHPSQSSTHSSSSSSNSKPTTPSRTPSVKSSKTPNKVQPQVPNYFFDDDDDDSWKICSVCGDKATGYHFNALTCEGCKGFFRRSMKNGKTFTCPYTGNCTITKSNRRQCQACRLEKCLRIGMKKECIMSHTEIQMKKNLMLHNRIKKSILEWKPKEYTTEKQNLVQLIFDSHCQTNNPPDIPSFTEEDNMVTERNPSASPASSTGSAFSDLINQMTQDIIATAPGQSSASKAHMRHFSAIMEFSIKEIIKFCKKIPSFITLSLKDQITLLKSGCTEILFIKANYTYDRSQEALMCGPGKYYTRESFILGGMSEEYTDCYLKFHHDLSHMQLDDKELSCLCAATLFSSDRDELENRALVESQQEEIVVALQAYTENTYHCRVRFSKIMGYLSRLRTLNWHISKTLQKLQNTESADDITPLVLEVVPSV